MPGPEHCHKCPNYVTIYLTYSTPPPPYPLYPYPCLSMSPFGGALCLSGMSDGISWSTHPFLSHLDSRTSTHKGDWVGEGRKELLAWRPLVHKVSEILPICFSNDLFVFHPQTSEYFGCSLIVQIVPLHPLVQGNYFLEAQRDKWQAHHAFFWKEPLLHS